MLLSLFPQAAKDIPAISASTSLTTSHVIPVADVSKESGEPLSTGRITFAVLASYIGAILGFKSTSATAGIGYATGAGGAITQGPGSGKSTGVTLDKICGTITMNNASLATATTVAFTLTNSTIAANDVVVIVEKSGGTSGAYSIHVGAVADGSCSIEVRNQSGASLSEAIVLNFAVIKAVAA
jgi:hypothetical protein